MRHKISAALLFFAFACADHGVVAADQAAANNEPTTMQTLPQAFDPKRDAAVDLTTAIKLAAEQHKRVLVDIGGDWCAACHELDAFFDANADLRRKRDAAFVWLKVNVSSENKNERLTKKLPWFIGYPHWFLLDEQGHVLHSSFAQSTRADFDKYLDDWAPRIAPK